MLGTEGTVQFADVRDDGAGGEGEREQKKGASTVLDADGKERPEEMRLGAAAVLATVLAAALAGTAKAQPYPVIENDMSGTLGQCSTDVDCTVYLPLNPGLTAADLVCNALLSRCQNVQNGDVISTNFDAVCTNTLLTLTAWAAMGSVGPRRDALVVVAVTMVPSTDIDGLIRLYGTPQVNASLQAVYASQQYISAPVTEAYFRHLAPGTYYAVYFDVTGCVTTTPTPVVTGIAVPPAAGAYLPVGFTFNDAAGYTGIPDMTVMTDPSGRARQVFLATAPGVWSAANVRTGPAYAGLGMRVPFCQVFDAAGGLVATATGLDALGPPLLTTVAGVAYPPGVGPPAAFFSDPVQQAYTAGFATFQCGIGFAMTQCPGGPTNCTTVYLRDGRGVLEGYVSAPNVLDMTVPGTVANSSTNLFNFYPQHYRWNGVGTSSVYLVDNVNPFGVNFRTEPGITVTPTGDPALGVAVACPSVATGVTVVMNYTAYPLEFNTALVRLQRVVNLGLVPLSPPQTFNTTVNRIYAFTNVPPGLVCAELVMSMNDNLGVRPVVRSCFQIGAAQAGMTQISSWINTGLTTVPNGTYPYLPYGGYESATVSAFAVTLPETVVLEEGQEAVVRLLRSSDIPGEEAQIAQFGATSLVFNDLLGTANFSAYYAPSYRTVGTTGNGGLYAPYILWTLRYSAFNGPALNVSMDIASSVQSPIAVAVLNIITPLVIPPYNNTNMTLSYACGTNVHMSMLEKSDIVVHVNVSQPICPSDTALFAVSGAGGIPFLPYNRAINVTGQPAGNNFPLGTPAVYYVRYVSADATSPAYGNVLYSGLNSVFYPAAADNPIEVDLIDAAGSMSSVVITAQSIIPENATIIAYLPQQPVCINSTQAVVLSYVLNYVPANNDTIEYWARVNVSAREAYDPNTNVYDLPFNCSLLYEPGWTPYTVYERCQVAPDYNDTACNGCRNLPPQLVNADGRTFTTSLDGMWLEVIVWRCSGVWDPDLGRCHYCRTGLSTQTHVPAPLALTFANFRRIRLTGNTVCLGVNCYAVTVTNVVDPYYATTYAPLVVRTSMPPLVSNRTDVYGGLGVNEVVVTLDVSYNITVFVPGAMCPFVEVYLPQAQGPLITFIHTIAAECGTPSGAVDFAVRYNDPDPARSGTQVNLCFYFPYRSDTTTADAPVSFPAPVNGPTELILPTPGNFPPPPGQLFVPMFTGIRDGTHQVMVYEDCSTGTAAPLSCNCIVPGTFQLSNPNLLFSYRTFTVDAASDPGGDIRIALTNQTNAQCFGDSYFLQMVVSDAANPTVANPLGIGNPPYDIRFFRPFDNGTMYIFATCDNNPGLPPPTDGNGLRVTIATLDIVIPTGGIYGLGLPGNYTLLARSCATQCARAFSVYIDIVEPLRIFLSPVGTDCAFTPGAISAAISGGTPYQRGDNQTIVYVVPGTTLVVEVPYKQFWLTPFTGGHYVEQYPGFDAYPGNYSLRACDRNGCCETANATVASPAPIVAVVAGFQGVCTATTAGGATNKATVAVNITGGVPPYETIQNLTVVTEDTLINATFVGTFNQTMSIQVVDSVGCILPTPITFRVPDPGPVHLTMTTTPSCALTPTGAATATSSEPITCTWIATGSPVPGIQSCHLTNLAAGTFLTVQAVTQFGCAASASVTVPTRPVIYVASAVRTQVSQFGGACVDNLTLTLAGGQFTPPYAVSLVNPPAPVPALYYDGNVTVLVEGLCASFEYTVLAAEPGNLCGITYTSVDPRFNLGGGTGEIDGLPLETGGAILGGGGKTRNKGDTVPWDLGLALVGAILISAAAVVALYYVS